MERGDAWTLVMAGTIFLNVVCYGFTAHMFWLGTAAFTFILWLDLRLK